MDRPKDLEDAVTVKQFLSKRLETAQNDLRGAKQGLGVMQEKLAQAKHNLQEQQQKITGLQGHIQYLKDNLADASRNAEALRNAEDDE